MTTLLTIALGFYIVIVTLMGLGFIIMGVVIWVSSKRVG